MDIRIVKSSAEQALSDENAKLENQMDACQAQVEAVGDISLEGMEGAAAEAATQTIHMHKAVVESHYSLYESLRSANEKNKRAVSGLYPTEGDVVDTKVAANSVFRRHKAKSLVYGRKSGETCLLRGSRTSRHREMAAARNH